MGALIRRGTALLLVLMIVISCAACTNSNSGQVTNADTQEDVNLKLWYTDDTLTAYLQKTADEYHQKNQNITIIPTLVDADEYLENIYEGSIKEENPADLYMLSSDNLEKAYLMGLAAPNDSNQSIYTEKIYGKAGMEASTYNDKLLGYPLTFETSVMVYNKKYVKPLNTFADLTNYSNSFQHTEENSEVEYIVKWDVSDLFTNYAFIGSYMNVGGTGSDDKNTIQLNSTNIKSCLTEYLKLKSDYGIVRNTTTASDCLDLFCKNKLLYTIVNTKDLKKINEVGVDYGICKIPNLTSLLKTNAMSTTQLMVVNPYSKNLKTAKSVAKAMTYDYAGELYDLSGLPSARNNLDHNPSSEYENLYEVYANSVVKAQFMNIGDFYLKLEIMLHQVWDGTSIEDSFNSLNSYVTTQLNSKTNAK